ncbi:MAG: redoxin family protein [Myxococcota bacterium]|nr:redoxin family protein [Myxococcota bacterium]
MWTTVFALFALTAAATPPRVGPPPPRSGVSAGRSVQPPGTMLECGTVDGEVPDFTLVDVSPGSPTHGESVDRPAFPGRVLVLYFALPTCGHCQAQVQQLQSMWTGNEDRWAGQAALQIIALAAGESGLPDLTEGLTLPVLQDTSDASVTEQYGAEKWYLYLIDRSGRVRHIHYRFDLTNTSGRLVAEIDALIAEEAP